MNKEDKYEVLIDSLFEGWHTGGSFREVYDFLGVSPEDYSGWIEQRLTNEEFFKKIGRLF